MNTMNANSLFDLAPDIEGIIVKELGVFLKFRECVKEFKGIVSNPDTKSRHKKFILRFQEPTSILRYEAESGLPLHHYPERHTETCIRNAWSLLNNKGTYWPYYLRQVVPSPKIHGFLYTGTWDNIHRRCETGSQMKLEATCVQLDAKLSELGAKGYKSKRKREKIKLLMSY